MFRCDHRDMREPHRHCTRVIPSPAEPGISAAVGHLPEFAGETDNNDGDLELATCADHLRHVARTAQQLTAALAVHEDFLPSEQQHPTGDAAKPPEHE